MSLPEIDLVRTSRVLAAASAFIVAVSMVLWEAHGLLALAMLVLTVVADAVLLAIAAETISNTPVEKCEADGIEGIAREFGLSPRETDVLETFARKRDICASASDLYISPGTVKAHLSHIYAKVGVSCCNELLRLCDDRSARAA